MSCKITKVIKGYNENESEVRKPAVFVRNACKRYGRDSPVLNKFSMTVQQGTIYALLGSSGCGKTTILSSIVGLKKLDSGKIRVFGANPGTPESGIPGKTVGYMPQEIGLYDIFSIQEALQYFGKIYGMTKALVQERITLLTDILNLPDCNCSIRTLSGGEQRRISLAVAMIHQPELLILDEPTVGVDPLLRASIWGYLCEIVGKHQTTVIITTHYIEEAKQADMIGLMRNGRLLIENSPLQILQDHNTIRLEDAVLDLCRNDNNNVLPLKHENEISQIAPEVLIHSGEDGCDLSTPDPIVGQSCHSRSPNNLSRSRHIVCKLDPKRTSAAMGFGCDLSSHINKIGALTIRNILFFLRFPMFLAGLIIMPTMTIILFNLVCGKDIRNLSMGVVNHEFQTVDYIEQCEQNAFTCFNDHLSCNFLTSFPADEIKWVPFSSEEDALKSVEKGQNFGYISIPKNFTQNQKDRFLLRNFVTNETMDGSEIIVRIDMAANIQGTFIRTGLYKYYMDFVRSLLSNCGEDSRAVEIPLKFNPVYGSLDKSFVDFIMPAQIQLIIFAIPMASSVSFILDKKAGTLNRNLVAGVEVVHVFISLIISEGLMIICALALSFGVLIVVFDFQIKGSIILAFLLCFLQGITGLSFGFVFGTLCDHEREMISYAMMMFVSVFYSSGGSWPLEGLPQWTRNMCNMLPTTLSIEALRSIVSRGWGISNFHVMFGFVSLTCWSTFCMVLSGIIYRIKK